MAGSLGDLGGLLKQAQKMQRQMQQMQEELAKRSFEGSAGGGAVVVTISGARELQDVKIQAEVVDPAEKEMLEDLVAAAVKDALAKVEAEHAEMMKGVSGGMGLPGMM